MTLDMRPSTIAPPSGSTAMFTPNTVENVWSLLKRSIVGSYHKVTVKHLDAYLDELEWRFNNRDNPYLFRDTLLKLIKAHNVQYKELVT